MGFKNPLLSKYFAIPSLRDVKMLCIPRHSTNWELNRRNMTRSIFLNLQDLHFMERPFWLLPVSWKNWTLWSLLWDLSSRSFLPTFFSFYHFPGRFSISSSCLNCFIALKAVRFKFLRICPILHCCFRITAIRELKKNICQIKNCCFRVT